MDQYKIPFEALSKRELQVLKALSMGQKRQDISSNLNISVLTYDQYRKSIRQKLRIKNQMDWGTVLLKINQKQQTKEI